MFKAIDLNYDYAITFDADGEHLTSDCKKFKEFIQSGYDLILGNRSYVKDFQKNLAKLFLKINGELKIHFVDLKDII